LTLLLSREDVADLIDYEKAIEIIADTAREEIEGTTFHMPQFGGGSTRRRTFRTVGGGLYGVKRMGIRSGSICQLFDTESGELVSILGHPFSTVRIGATLGLGARYLSRPDCKVLGLLGSGRSAMSVLEFLAYVRPIERVEHYSPTPEHRAAFAQRATKVLGLPVTPRSSADEVIAEADIIAAATDSIEPVVRYADLRPGVHVSSMGRTTELDADVYKRADQFAVVSRFQEVDSHHPDAHPKYAPGGPIYQMAQAGQFDTSSIVEIGSILNGDIAPISGREVITLFRDSRGGVGDVALAAYAYERARELGRGQEFNFDR